MKPWQIRAYDVEIDQRTRLRVRQELEGFWSIFGTAIKLIIYLVLNLCCRLEMQKEKEKHKLCNAFSSIIYVYGKFQTSQEYYSTT